MAYEISPAMEPEVRRHLDYREKDGYETVTVKFHPKHSTMPEFDLEIYVGDSDNPFFLGPADTEDIARQICHAIGPSGENTEYLFRLAEFMRTAVPDEKDEHLYELELTVRKLQQESGHTRH